MLQVRGLTKTFRTGAAAVAAVQQVDFAVAEGEFLVLLGPSGCGKTTTLRAVAGLERPDDGEITIDNQPVFSAAKRLNLRPEKRPIAMVFQSYAIWPHMSVQENVAFPLREGVRRVDKATLQARVADVLELLGLEGLGDRQVTTLSGGQQQRVALARALALQPKVLLMDEPLSNLDFKLRARLRVQMKELMHRLGLTTVYVTHDQTEALEMGDRIAVMNHGRIAQLGPPRAIYEAPANEFVARFVGEMNLLPSRLLAAEPDHWLLDTPLGRLSCGTGAAEPLTPGDACLFGVRPEDVRALAQSEPTVDSADNTVAGTVEAAQYVGDAMVYSVRVGSTLMRARVHRGLDLARGAAVTLQFAPAACIAVRPERDGALLDEELEGAAQLV